MSHRSYGEKWPRTDPHGLNLPGYCAGHTRPSGNPRVVQTSGVNAVLVSAIQGLGECPRSKTGRPMSLGTGRSGAIRARLRRCCRPVAGCVRPVGQ